MKKKGFTLIELLAVIVILAIIALIAAPSVLNIIEDSRKSSVIESARAIIRDARNYYVLEKIKGRNVEEINLSSDILKYKGDKPDKGYIGFDEQGGVILKMYMNGYCVISEYEGEITATKTEANDCDVNLESIPCYEFNELKSYTVNVDNCVAMFGPLFQQNFNSTTDEITAFCKDGSSISGISLKIFIDSAPIEEFTNPEMPILENLVYEKSCKTCFDMSYAAKSYKVNTDVCYEMYSQEMGEDIATYCDQTNPNGVIVRIEEFFNQALLLNLVEDIVYDETKPSIKSYNCFEGNALGLPTITDVTIPSRIKIIDPDAFREKGITSVDFSNAKNLETIGSYAFFGNLLPNLDLSKQSKLTQIEDYAFNNNDITDIKLPNGLIDIKEGVFGGNELTKLELPTSVKTIGKKSFSNNKIENLNLATATGLKRIGEYAFENNGMKKITLPDGLETIGSYVFNKNIIEELKLPKTLKTIEDHAFYEIGISGKLDLSYLTELEYLGNYAFAFNFITELDLHNSTKLSKIGNKTFAYNNISSVSLPTSIVEIEDYSFQCNRFNGDFSIKDLPNLERIGKSAVNSNVFTGELDLSNLKKLKIIDEEAFYGQSGCIYNNDDARYTKVEELKLPSNIEVIGKSAFYGNDIKTIDFSNSNKLHTIGKSAFELNELSGTLDLRSLTGLKNISDWSFCDNSIKKIYIPNNVTTIGTGAFASNSYEYNTLTHIYIDNYNGSISGSPWGASSSTIITWQRTQ